MKYIFIAAFGLMVIMHWVVPIKMIADANGVIENGTEFHFKTRPVDPTDPFRGKYITLQYEAEMYLPADTTQANFTNGQEVYAFIDSDPDGYARIIFLSAQEPTEGDYITADVSYAYINEGAANVTLEFPFNRFYLEESKASEAEQLTWRNRIDSGAVTYAKVMVNKGKATITDVIVNDSSIVDVINRINAAKANP